MVVEDGTGLANADSYTTTTFADTYFHARGNKDWCQIDVDTKETLLVQATDYIELRWAHFFTGCRAVDGQALSFPRWDDPYEDYVPASLPLALQKATAEYALRAIDGPLAPDLLTDQSGYAVQRRKEKVGPIEEEVEFATGQNGSMQARTTWKTYPGADYLLAAFLRTNSNRVIRN